MPGKDDLSTSIAQDFGVADKPSGYDPDLSASIAKDFNVPVTTAASTNLGTPNIAGGNPAYNVSDESKLDKGVDAQHVSATNPFTTAWWSNTADDFKQAYYSAQLQAIVGKEQVGASIGVVPWAKYEGPQAIQDIYPQRIAQLDKDLKAGNLTQEQYNEQKASLDTDKDKADQKMAEYEGDRQDLQDKIDKIHINPYYQQQQQVINSKGDAASLWDRTFSGAGNSIGSTASFIIPGLLADFGNKAVANIIKTGATQLIPGVGEYADVVGVAGAALTTIATHLASRASEAYMEVAGPYLDSVNRLSQQYLKDHPQLTDASQIPDEDQRQIRIQSRQGIEQQFKSNMFLSASDVALAALLPGSNIGYGVGKYLGTASKFLGGAEHVAGEAAYMGKMAKIASRIGKEYVEMQGEGFEEGYQQAAQYRADAANARPLTGSLKDQDAAHDKETSWSNVITNALQDGFDTVASLDLVPGQAWSNMGGKYGKNADFQQNAFGGQFLGSITAMPLTALAVRKDIQRFNMVNKDLVDSGVLNAPSKFQAIRNSILEKYFKSDQVDYLASALKDLKNSKDEAGNLVYDPKEMDATAKSIKDAYEIYQDVNQHMEDRVGHDRVFGMFDSGELSTAKDKLRSDLFNAATSITMHNENRDALDTKIEAQKIKDGVFANDGMLNEKTALLAKQEALQKSLTFAEGMTNQTAQYQEQHWTNKLTDRISTLKASLAETNDALKNMGDVEASVPSSALVDLMQQRDSTDNFLKQSKDKYNELAKIRTKAQLKDYAMQNAARPVPPTSTMNNATPAQATTQPAAQAAQTQNQPATAPATSPQQTTQAQAPQEAEEPNQDSPEEQQRKHEQEDFKSIIDSDTTPQEKGKAIDEGYRAVYPDAPTKLPISTVLADMRDDWFKDDPGYFRKNFGAIQEALASIHPGQKPVAMDDAMQFVDPRAASTIPPIQNTGMDDLNEGVVRLAREAGFEPGTGNKITDSLSVAQSNTQYDTSHNDDGSTQFGTARDANGDPIYNDTDQQLNNTAEFNPGTEVYYRLEKDILNKDFEGLSQQQIDDQFDKAQIGIYKTIRTTQGGVTIEKEVRSGAVHTMEFLRKQLSDTLNGVPIDVEAEKQKNRRLRENIIRAGKAAEPVKTKVKSKGFGYLEPGATKLPINTALKGDVRPYITVNDNTGRPIPIGDTKFVNIQGKGMIPGAVVLAIPNGDVHFPAYLTKGQIATDKAIHATVLKSVQAFLQTGARKELQHVDPDGNFGAEAFVYVTSSKKDLLNMSPGSGIYAFIDDTGVPSVKVGTRTFTGDEAQGLEDALGKIYVNVNRQLIQGEYARKYNAALRDSNVLTTNIQPNPIVLNKYQSGEYSFLKEGDQYQYFTQHTLALNDPFEDAKPVEEVKAPAIEGDLDAFAGIEAVEEPKSDQFGELLGGFDDVSDHADVPSEPVDEGYMSKVLVSDKISPALQNIMVDSLAYMLRPNGKDTATSEAAKQGIQARADAIEKELAKPNLNASLVSQYQVRLAKMKLFLEHYDALESKARDVLEQLGVRKVEAEDDFSDINQQESAEEGNIMDQYGDEYNSTRNEKDFLGTDLKMLVHFIPKLVSLDMSKPNDLAAYQEGKKNYRQVPNELGFKSFNNFNDTYQKALAITSSEHFDSTLEGVDAVLAKMKDPNNDPVVQELALALEAAPLQTRIAFFNHACLQSQVNMTLLYTVKKLTKWANKAKEEFNKKTAYLFRSDRRSAIKKVESDLKNEFMVSGTELMHEIYDPTIEKKTYLINTDVAKGILAEAHGIADDDKSYMPRVKRAKGVETQEASDTFTPAARIALFRIVKRTGINIQFAAFCDLLRLGNRSLSKQGGERATFQDLFLHKYLKTLAGNNKATSEGTPFEENSPFKQEASVIRAMAEQELKYRVLTTNGAYRMDGKSYFSYTRHNIVSEIALQLKKDSPFLNSKLAFDNFAKYSRVLQGIANGMPGIKPTIKYELGSKNKTSNDPAKLLKNMSPREHTITRIAMFQNNGAANPVYMYDTLSDKVTKFLGEGFGKVSIQGYNGTIGTNIALHERTLNELMRYFNAEQDRIQQVQSDNKEFNNAANGKSYKIIKGYHDVLNKDGSVKKEGMGKYFNMYYFLNKAMLDIDNPTLSGLMYGADGTLKTDLPMNAIKAEINKHFNKLFAKNRADWEALGLFKIGEENGNVVGDIHTIIDHNYLTHGVTISDSNRTVESPQGVLYHMGLSLTKDQNRSLNEGRYADLLGPDLLNKIVDYAVVDYVVNSAMFSNEAMMIFGGDPAQAGKLADSSIIKKIEKENAGNAAAIRRDTVLAHIMSTFNNVSKRNASLTASGTKGAWKTRNYTLAIANDIAIDSKHIDDYKRMFADNVPGIIKAYEEGDLTDAQEFTTVEEHLHAMAAFDKISYDTYKKALYLMDRRAFDEIYPNESFTLSKEEKARLEGIVMQAQKPMQRTANVDGDQKMSKQYYVKTSSHPIIPELVIGTPLEHLLDDMRKKGVNRVAFVSGVKQGVAGSANLFNTDKDGNETYNENFLTNNINTLDRNGFRMQVEVPYHEDKDAIREGTQQSKLMFVDIPHALEVVFRGKATPVGDVQNHYIDYHKKILALHKKELMTEITNKDGSLNRAQLSKILQEEGKDRGYAMGSLLGLDLDSAGQFKIPLTFLPDVGRIEPILTSILSSRLCRFKMPGNSDVQSSEWWLKTGKKGKVVSGEDLSEAISAEDRRGIIWTKPEYANTSKLSYLHKDKDGQVHNSQIVMPFYFIKDGKKLKASDFTKKVMHNGVEMTVIDTDRIDPELLQTNGFRIPYQGHNSGMWFEIIGFLPESLGNLVVVPGEIAGQMGSDYDVDKLYRYTYNYTHKESYERLGANPEEWESLMRATNLKLADMGVEKGEDDRYSKEDYQRALAAVVEETYVDKGKEVPKHIVVKKNSSKYDIAKIHEDDPSSVEGLQNAIIDAQKAIYTSPDEAIMKAILDPLSFKDVQDTISLLGVQGTTKFLGAFDPIYQRDGYFSNVTGKLATAICANANTSHAMAQTSNLYVKGQGVVFFDEKGGTYKDRTSASDHNRVNAYNAEHYMYETITDGVPKMNDQNDGTNNSAWRLDKVFTFPDPVTGAIHRISNLISQLLGVSVDNAKEQLLGAFGINKENLSVALTIVRHGFTFNMVNAFINQPILKKYYEAIGDAEDIYDLDYVANKANAALTDLFTEYGKMAGMDNDAINNLIARKGINGQKFSDLRSSLTADITPTNAMQQLEILKAYLRYKEISESLATLTGTFGIDVKGLPANMAQTYKKAEDIKAILTDSDVLGNVTRYSENTIPGVFSGVPDLAVKLFMDSTNPAIAYTSPAYMTAKNLLMEVAGKNQLFTEQIDTFHAHAKQFIYSGFRIDDEDVRDGRQRLLFDTPDNQSMQSRLTQLKATYPNNEFLDSIGLRTSDNPANPKLILIEPSSEGDYIQRVKDQWENMLRDNEHPDLRAYAIDMVKYAMWVQPQEFGSSTITKYLPDIFMLKNGLSEYLQRINSMTSDPDFLANFVRQFIQHNPDVLISAREKQMGNIAWYRRAGQITNKFTGETYQGQVNVAVDNFMLPAIPTEKAEFAKNKAVGLIRNGSYPKYLRFYTDEVGDQVYEQSENTDGSFTYNRITKLGDTDVSEYDIATPYQISGNSVTYAGTLVNDNVINNAVPAAVAVQTALRGAGTIKQQSTQDYVTLGSVDKILEGLIAKANEVAVDPRASKQDKAYAKYYAYLGSVLQHNGLENVNVELSNTNEYAGHTSADGKTVTFAQGHFRDLMKGIKEGRGGLSPELEKERTILHEFIHARVAKGLAEGKHTEEYKKIREVHEAFKKAMRTNNVIRGVDVSALDAELFSALRDSFDDQHDNKNFLDFAAEAVKDDDKLRGYFEKVGQKLEDMANKGQLADKNYDLVSNTARFNAFKEHVQKTFKKGSLNPLVNKYYAYHNIDEFVTEAMTNPKVQNVLRGVPGLWKSFIKSLKDFIANLLGVETVERTLFDDALDSIYSFMGKPEQAPEEQAPSAMTEASEAISKTEVPLSDRISEEDQEKKGSATTSIKKKEDLLNSGQKEGVEKIIKVIDDKHHDDIFDDMSFLSGKGGTGKTFTTEVIIDKILAKSPLARIAHVAPTWNAVNEIMKASDDPSKKASTLASFVGTELGKPDKNGVRQFILNKDDKVRKFPPAIFTADYIILDEASMIGGDGQAPKENSRGDMVSTDAWETIKYRLMQREQWYGTTPKKIILVGDYAQIPPVGTRPDHDAPIIEEMMNRPNQYQVLTQNMRLIKNPDAKDLDALHEAYRINIDNARAAFKKGIPSNTSIDRNPIPFATRKDSANIKYLRTTEDAVEKFVAQYLKDPENVTNVVFVNYNAYSRPETQELVSKIRQKLFPNSNKPFNPGELTLLDGNMGSKIHIDGVDKVITWHNETRFHVKAIEENVKKRIREGMLSFEFEGSNMTLVTDYGKKRVEFTQFIPNPGEVGRIFGNYIDTIKGFRTEDGTVVPYGAYIKLKESLPALQYGYVVNSHKVQGSSYEHTFVDEENILKSPETNKGFNNMMYTAVSRPKQTLHILNPANPAEQGGPVGKRNWNNGPTPIDKPVDVLPGVKLVSNTGLDISQANGFIDLLKPLIAKQAYKENKGRYANSMFHIGLMWSRRNDERYPSKSAPLDINSKAGGYDPYGYTVTDQHGRALPSMATVRPITSFIESKLGIDMSQYDSVIANIYEPDNFISEHSDTSESTTAEKFPVIVINLGAGGNIVLGQGTTDANGTLLQNGSVYAFGVGGTNRYIRHRTFSGHNAVNPLQSITLPDGREVKDYRITLTFRRAQDITPGSSPRMITQNVVPSQGINISTKSEDALGRALTNPTWGSKKDGKDYYDVESWYKANKSKLVDPTEAMKADMNTMYRGILHKLSLHPELIQQIAERGGVKFLEASSHIVGVKDSRWEGQGRNSKFIRVLIAAYEHLTRAAQGKDDLASDDIITDLILRGLLKTKC